MIIESIPFSIFGMLLKKRLDTIVSNLCFQYGAGDGNRTHVNSLEGYGFTIKLHPHVNGREDRI